MIGWWMDGHKPGVKMPFLNFKEGLNEQRRRKVQGKQVNFSKVDVKWKMRRPLIRLPA